MKIFKIKLFSDRNLRTSLGAWAVELARDGLDTALVGTGRVVGATTDTRRLLLSTVIDALGSKLVVPIKHC